MDPCCPWYSCQIWCWEDLRCFEESPRLQKVFDCPLRCQRASLLLAAGKICTWATHICCTSIARLAAYSGMNCPDLGTGTRMIFYSADTRTCCYFFVFVWEGWISPVALSWYTEGQASRTSQTCIFHFCISCQSKLAFKEIYSHLNSIFVADSNKLHFYLCIEDPHFFKAGAI